MNTNKANNPLIKYIYLHIVLGIVILTTYSSKDKRKLKDIIEEADNNMYEKKKEMKLAKKEELSRHK